MGFVNKPTLTLFTFNHEKGLGYVYFGRFYLLKLISQPISWVFQRLKKITYVAAFIKEFTKFWYWGWSSNTVDYSLLWEQKKNLKSAKILIWVQGLLILNASLYINSIILRYLLVKIWFCDKIRQCYKCTSFIISKNKLATVSATSCCVM